LGDRRVLDARIPSRKARKLDALGSVKVIIAITENQALALEGRQLTC
jgi:hypothetical protein